MKKRLLILFCTALLSLSLLVGCGSSDTSSDTDSDSSSETSEVAETTSWADGTYTASTTGKNGSFDVTVVITDGAIESVTIGENAETQSKAGDALENLPNDIVEAQSCDVDTYSGATVTSEAILDGVSACLEEASE